MTPDEVALIHSIVRNSPRKRVSVEAQVFKEVFKGFTGEKIMVDKETNQPLFVLVDKDKALRYLQDRYNVKLRS